MTATISPFEDPVVLEQAAAIVRRALARKAAAEAAARHQSEAS